MYFEVSRHSRLYGASQPYIISNTTHVPDMAFKLQKKMKKKKSQR